MNNCFEEIRNILDVKTVAEHYNIEVLKNNSCVCPFHEDHHPSAHIYPNAFHCFTCNVHYDVIGLTMRLFDLSAIEAAKKLNDDFSLGINFSNHSVIRTASGTPDFIIKRNEKRIYAEWENKAWRTLRDKYRILTDFKEKYAPLSPYDKPDIRFSIACRDIDYTEYLLEEFLVAPFDERKAFNNEVIKADTFLKRYSSSLSELPRFSTIPARTSATELLKRSC